MANKINANVACDKDTAIKAYDLMLLIRRFEERAAQLYGMGQIGGFCHLCIGQEAVYAGLQLPLKKGDGVITSYRDHGLMLAAGSHPNIVMAELLGRVTGCSKGKGGSMHMFDLGNHFYGGHGIVAAQVPIGTGIAFANKYKENGNIAIVYFGDGAANQGQVYESFNMAKLWGLPVLYVIENNEYAMGTSVERSSSTEDLYKRGNAFGIEGVRVNGMDFVELYNSAKTVIDAVRNESKPMLMEVKTYRYRGHSMSDPATYRSKEEVNKYKTEMDPIESLKAFILTHEFATEQELETLEEKIMLEVKKCVEFAQNSPQPGEEELFTDIYS